MFHTVEVFEGKRGGLTMVDVRDDGNVSDLLGPLWAGYNRCNLGDDLCVTHLLLVLFLFLFLF